MVVVLKKELGNQNGGEGARFAIPNPLPEWF